MNRTTVAFSWVAVTALLTTATWAAVNAASSRVADAPTAPVIAVTDGTEPDVSVTTSSVPGSDATVPSATSSTTTPGSDGTTTTTTSTTTPGSPTTTTTTTTGTGSGSTTIPTAGGTVIVSYSGGNVFLEAASPVIGYEVDVREPGPDEVRVRFEAEDSRVEVRVRWRDGRLDVEVSSD